MLATVALLVGLGASPHQESPHQEIAIASPLQRLQQQLFGPMDGAYKSTVTVIASPPSSEVLAICKGYLDSIDTNGELVPILGQRASSSALVSRLPKEDYHFEGKEQSIVNWPKYRCLSSSVVVTGTGEATSIMHLSSGTELWEEESGKLWRRSLTDARSELRNGLLMQSTTAKEYAAVCEFLLTQPAATVQVNEFRTEHSLRTRELRTRESLAKHLLRCGVYPRNGVIDLGCEPRVTITTDSESIGEAILEWISPGDNVLVRTVVSWDDEGRLVRITQERFTPGTETIHGGDYLTVEHCDIDLLDSVREWRPQPGGQVVDMRFDPYRIYTINEDGSFPDDSELRRAGSSALRNTRTH